MSFGRKGLAPGQAAPAQAGGGFGRASQAGAPAPQPASHEDIAEIDDLAARREAFIASERARKQGQLGPGQLSDVAASPEAMKSFHTGAVPAARMAEPARPAAPEPVGELGLPRSQEAQIRAAAKGMADGKRTHRTSPTRVGASQKKFLFGAPSSRNLIMAYVLWYFAGGFGLHRVYCGSLETGMYQVGLLVGSVVVAFIFIPIGLIGFGAWVIWIFADLFLMPGMMRRFKAAHEYDAGVFE